MAAAKGKQRAIRVRRHEAPTLDEIEAGLAREAGLTMSDIPF
jgi:hypothetical protein